MSKSIKPGGLVSVLVISGGYEQLRLIEAVKALGYFCVVADARGKIPGASVADEILNVERYDVSKILEVIAGRTFDGVVSGGSDRGILVMAQICEAIGLKPYVSAEAALMPMRKHEMRRILDKGGVSTPKSMTGREFSQVEEAAEKLGFPVVVKPTGGIGQLGVSRVSAHAELRAAYEAAVSATKGDTVLVEPFLDGPEVGVNGFVIDGEFNLLTVTDRDAVQEATLRFGVALSKRYPAKIEASEASAAAQEIAKAVRVLGWRNGPVYAQVKMTVHGPIVLEVMPRLGGGEDPRMVEHAVGFDMARATVLASLGEKIDSPKSESEMAISNVSMRFLTTETGQLKAVHGVADALKSSFIKEVIIYPAVGDHLAHKGTSKDRVGMVLASGVIQKEVEAASLNACQLIKFEFEQNEETKK
jgi:biotin carboxylase